MAMFNYSIVPHSLNVLIQDNFNCPSSDGGVIGIIMLFGTKSMSICWDGSSIEVDIYWLDCGIGDDTGDIYSEKRNW